MNRVFLIVALAAFLGACGGETTSSGPADSASKGAASGEEAIPQPDMTDMEPQVARRLRETRDAIVANPTSAEAWGRFGMVAHAHELWEEASTAYRQAQRYDFDDARWPYFHGDVLTVIGTEPDLAASAFRRALELRANYAPTHMRLGQVLMGADRHEEASKELTKALEIEPSLQPAQVALAQIELAAGRLDRSEELLGDVLASSPRHAQALAALGKVYLRQGRRDEARKVAERARDAAVYNLYSDPLMGEVVNEGVSSTLIWERARAFLDNGEDEQAARGLEQVVKYLPDNPDVHHQLALAYRNLGVAEGARAALERVVSLDPERVEARLQAASIYLDLGQGAPAMRHLEEALKIRAGDSEARLLLGRAKMLAGDPQGALRAFETAGVDGRDVPVWAHNEWGAALAQTGRPQSAMDRFKLALEIEPDNAQSLFYLGLIYEGLARPSSAVEYYCRSMKAQANPLAGGRLQAMGRTCP